MKFKSAFPYITAFVLVPLCIAVGVFAFRGKAYLPVSVCIALLSCLPFFLAFEKKNGNVQLAVILAVMTALSVLGRFAFAAIPHFKPVSAIVIITGMYLGAQSGFLCGALSAVLSNILFGQGPWTPFQMLAWGLIGLFAALLGGILKKKQNRACCFRCARGRFLLAYHGYMDSALVGGIFALALSCRHRLIRRRHAHLCRVKCDFSSASRKADRRKARARDEKIRA